MIVRPNTINCFRIRLTKYFKTYLKNKVTLLVPGGAGLRLWRFVCLRLGLFRFNLRKGETLQVSADIWSIKDCLQRTDHVEKYYEHTFYRYEKCCVTHFLSWIFAAIGNSGFRLYSFRHVSTFLEALKTALSKNSRSGARNWTRQRAW